MVADVRPMKTNAELALAETFASRRETLPGGADIAARRVAAFDSFVAKGLPHRKVESWRYTDLRALLREAAPLAATPDADALAAAKAAGGIIAAVDARRLYLVNGTFAAEISDLADLEPGLSIISLAAALSSGDALVAEKLGKTVATSDVAVALNTAFMGDGVVIKVAEGTALARPIALINVTVAAAPVASFTRSLLVLEKGASATLFEVHEGPAGVAYQVNTALELLVADDAALDRVKITREGSAAFHVSSLLADFGARTKVNTIAFTTGGAVVRNQLLVTVGGEFSEIGIGGVTLSGGKQHTDTLLAVDHAAANCVSRESFRAVLDGSAQDIFQGCIAVKKHAQKTDARMLTRALLLSENAEADAKPELEIFADDVQCGHGCTTGTLDQQLKFYLMARGIPAKEAEALLIQAFVGEVIDGIANEGVRSALTEATQAWLLERE